MKTWVQDKLFFCLEKIEGYLSIIFHKVPIFEPDRPFRFIFDIFMLFYFVCLSANITLKYGFNLTRDDYLMPLWILFEILPIWIFLVEILLDLNTSYYSKGIYIRKRSQIVKHYFKYNFLLDVLTVFPLFLQINKNGEILEIMAVFRLINVENLIKRLEECLQLKGKKEGAFQLIKLIINLLFLAHICACAWHSLGSWEISNGFTDNWLEIKNIDQEKWFIKYIYALYFSIVTMMTVGYGDISAKNYIECCFNILIIIYGCGVFAYSINNIGNIFKEMYQEDKEFK